MSQSGREVGEIRQHSGWLILLGLVLVVLALCLIVLLYDLRPGTGLFRNSPPPMPAPSVSRSGVCASGCRAIIWTSAPPAGAATWM